MSNIPQPENRSAQDDVDRQMVRSNLNELIAKVISIRAYFLTHHPTKGRTDAIATCDRVLKALRDHLDVAEMETRQAPHDQHLLPSREHPKPQL